MFTVRNLVENATGNIDCSLLSEGEWIDFTMSPNDEYELHKDSDWPGIKPCDADKITAYQQVQSRNEFKAERQIKISELTVETNLGIFDADEVSQTRMSRAISVMSDTDTNLWVLANNSPVEVAKADLIEALILAGKAQSDLWVQP